MFRRDRGDAATACAPPRKAPFSGRHAREGTIVEVLTGKVAVVTGTANPRGIGVATCRRLAQEGAVVVLTDLDGDGAEDRASELRAEGFDAAAVQADMGDHGSVLALSDAVYARYGAVHIVHVNHMAPGGLPGHGLLAPEPDAWDLTVRVNLLGAVYAIKAFVPRMIASGEHGHMLVTASGAGNTGTMYGNAPYSVTKCAQVSLMECLYGQLRDTNADIVATVVFPGVTATMPTDEMAQGTEAMLRQYGLPATLMEPQNVAEYTLEAIRNDSFWAHPTLDDDQRLTGGTQAELTEWEHDVWRTRLDAMISRSAPDPYLWGPPSSLLGPS
jgi:NAD(P)-dependent dehydrogenase (short-subunit alcohol dehydrogenase family)